MRKLKYTLNRRSLETMYLSFVRPILEYGDTVWCNITQYESNQLEKVQIEAARIVTGATKLCSIENLYHETGWQSLESRRTLHCLTAFYKIVNGQSPIYLSSLIPATNNTPYALRNTGEIRTVRCRTSLYQNSFLPSSIQHWNSLDIAVRNSPSLSSFKHNLTSERIQTSKHFYYGKRKTQILHTRLRTGCSGLKYDLFRKNIVESPFCTCGRNETTSHYFFECPKYIVLRAHLLNTVSNLCTPSLGVLLCGNLDLSNEANEEIFKAVHKFIDNSKRFERQ